MNTERTLSSSRFWGLFENIPDGVYETSPEGEILAANPALVRMLGFSSEEELRGEGAAGLYLDPEQRELYARTLEDTGRLANAELRLRRKDGSCLVVLEHARAVKDESGKVLYYQGTLTDITERKEAEQALRKARDEALEASRLKSQFLANISHELRTPLNAVLGMSQILLSTQPTPAVRECAETIHLSARILVDHITEILDFSRIEAGRLELESIPFDVREIIHQAAAMLAARAADKGLMLVAWAEPDVPGEVHGDPARLQQVLVNLLSNAVKFTERGEVELRVSVASGSDDSCVLRFEVRDTGIGIAASVQELIFEPFRQADGSTTRQYGGTGLGLSIVREILREMGSQIELESEPGAGSRFSFEIEVPVGVREGRPVVEGSVVLLEPNATARRALETWLEACGAIPIPVQDVRALEQAVRDARIAGTLRAVVIHESTIPADRGWLPRLLSGVSDGLRPSIALISGWESPNSGIDTDQDLPMSRLKMPLNENEFLIALERGATASMPASLESLARTVGEYSPPPPAQPHRQVRLLVAEDNLVNQTVARRMAEKLGYTVDVAANGREALEALRRCHYDLVLMDCQMPEMDGLRATAAIRASEESGRRIPIIALTAHASSDDRKACLDAGMDDYLSKPLSLADLGEKLRKWSEPIPAESPAGEAPQGAVRG